MKASGLPGIDGLADDVLNRCIEAATEEIERICFPRHFIKATYASQWYDGALACGRNNDELWLEQYPIVTGTSVTVKENGVVLTLGTGYDTSGVFQVLREDARGLLRRRGGHNEVMLAEFDGIRFRGWRGGRQNIEVTYTAGYDLGSVPKDLEQACIELTLLVYKQARRSGTAGSSMASGSIEVAEKLPDRTMNAIQRHAPWGRPRARAA